MSQLIIRLYGTAGQATDAVNRLKAFGFMDELITRVDPAPGKPVESIAKTISSANVLNADAKVYATAVVNGRTFLSIDAPFGMGGYAAEILDRFDPVPSGVSHSEPYVKWDDAAPFSSALHIPVALKGTAVFSTFWSLPALVRSNWSLSSLFGIPMLSGSSRFGNSKFGLPLLTSREFFFTGPPRRARASR